MGRSKMKWKREKKCRDRKSQKKHKERDGLPPPALGAGFWRDRKTQKLCSYFVNLESSPFCIPKFTFFLRKLECQLDYFFRVRYVAG